MAVGLKPDVAPTGTDGSKGAGARKVSMQEIAVDRESDGERAGEAGNITVMTSTQNTSATGSSCRRKRVLLSTESCFAQNFLPTLMENPAVELRLITDEEPSTIPSGTNRIPHYMDSVDYNTFDKKTGSRKWLRAKAAELSEWADLLVVAPIDAGTMGSMLYGLTNTLTLSLLRSWDSRKPVLIVPGMTVSEWENPLTARQLGDIEQHWPWVMTIVPLLWQPAGPEELTPLPWDGKSQYLDAVHKTLGTSANNAAAIETSLGKTVTSTHADKSIDPGVLLTEGLAHQAAKKFQKIQDRRPNSLPLELWLDIFEDHLGDWEIAKAVGIPTRLAVPKEWQSHILKMSTPASLEYTILRGSFAAIKSRIEALPRWKPLSDLACHLIFKFSRTDILTYLSENHLDLFWTTTRLTNLPYRASAIYGNPTILTWWRDSAALPTKEYIADALDGASRAGFIHVLDWWRSSGLPLRYTERALESASAEGRINVLDWWKKTSMMAPSPGSIPMKVGKSVLLAAQSGNTDSLAWWDSSGIPYTHSESVARIASAHGHIHVLELWHRLKGTKMIFDNQVLVGATKNGHDDILEWWRRSGLRVEFKTCDIEEALEDADPASGAEERVRRWWSRNGLNLGVGTSEWMKVKVLS
jgi:hypothetical protein